MTPILETAIGIIFVFLIFSLITSWVVEWISMRLSRRGKLLRQFIYSSLQDPVNASWGPQIYGHPLIDALHHNVSRPGTLYRRLIFGKRLDARRRLPAYIPADQFARAFVDVVRQSSKMPEFVKDKKSGRYQVADTTVIGNLDNTGFLTDATPMAAFRQFVLTLNQMQPGDVQTTLAAIAREINPESQDALKELQAGIATWYEAGMERLTGWYKRSTRPWLFGIGLVVAIGFNVDTMRVVSRLYADPQMRVAVNQAANRFIAANDSLPKEGDTISLDDLQKKIINLRASLDPLNLPIGWGQAMDDLKALQGEQPVREGTLWHQIRSCWYLYIQRPATMAWAGLPEHALGWLLTALAISFGSSFWFDLLKRVVNMRSQGLKPEAEVKKA